VPRKNTAGGGERRRRGAKAAPVDTERGLALRVLLHSPKDTVAAMLAFAAACGVVTNAVFLQAGPHPAPMFGSTVVNLAATQAAPNLLPRPRPVEADTASSEPRPIELKTNERTSERASDFRASETKAVEPRVADPLANLVRATTPSPSPQPSTSATPMASLARVTTPSPSPSPQPSTTGALSYSSNAARPPAPITPLTGARRVAAVQRTLTEYGYGQLKPTGTVGSDTQAAIQKFERDRKLPVTGQVSDRLLRELAAMIGHPVE
jgi:Putative peptidoglycan binding domain